MSEEPRDITVESKHGTVVYLDAQENPAEPEDAVSARVVFDDGSFAEYRVVAQKRGARA